MQTWICEICGEAYLGEMAPVSCPYCGARKPFIKPGKEAHPVFLSSETLSSETLGFLNTTLELEMHANAIYSCMEKASKDYEIKKMFKRLATVELEHAAICVKLLKIEMPAIKPETCSQQEIENFKKTIELEKHASTLYAEFAKKSVERHIKILFTALNQAEMDHIILINNYLQ